MTEMEPLKPYRSEDKVKGADIDQEVYREEIRGLIEKVVRFLVDEPESVTVTTYVGPKTTVYRVNCAKDNLGQVIGAQGKTIMGLRAVVHAMTARNGIRSIVEIPV
ncbi:MAG TPA: KH domain-containing protein [Bdellovibrio sp.]|uniref:KH domain-containing protein n=1 Tax=Bdellovibrio sp. TaxID=28201 RepID=UPI002EFC57A3